VEVDGAGLLEDARSSTRRGAIMASRRACLCREEGSEGAHGFGDAATGLDDLLVRGGLLVPLPCVLEGGDLGGGARAVLLAKRTCSPGGVEGRIE